MVDKNEKDLPCIGIDLGTCNSCVGVFVKGEVTIVPNENGNKTTPSVVSFGAAERKIGEAAKNAAHRNPEQTIFSAKRLMGLTMQHDELKKKNEDTPVEIVAGPDEKPDENGNIKPKLKINFKGEEHTLSPEDISAMILTKMREIAETFTGIQGIRDAVITVPAYFNDTQREATKTAGRIAGLNVVRLVNEPTAAAIAYGLEQKKDTAETVFVFDFGGGTLDCTLLKIDKTKEDPEYIVSSTSGDCALGGDDFDNVITTFCADIFEKDSGIDVMRSGRSMRRLKAAAETAKKDLSGAVETTIQLDALAKDADFEYVLTREEFEKISDGLIKKALPVIDEALKGAKMTVNDIDQIVLVGGSSRIPKVQAMLSEKFGGKQLNYKVNPDEAVAYGATLLCAQMTERAEGNTKTVDVTPLNLGIEIEESEDVHRMSIMIPKNTQLPFLATKSYTTVMNNAPQIHFRILQGDGENGQLATECTELSKVILDNVPEGPAGEPDIIVTFDINKEGILKMTAKDADEINAADVTIQTLKAQGKANAVQEGQALQAIFNTEEQKANNNDGAKNAFVKFCADMVACKDDKEKMDQLSGADVTTLGVCIDLGEQFMAENKNATATEYEQKIVEIQEFYTPLLEKMNDLEDYPEPKDLDVEDYPEQK